MNNDAKFHVRSVRRDPHEIDRVMQLIRQSTKGKTQVTHQQLIDDLFDVPLALKFSLKKQAKDYDHYSTNRPFVQMIVLLRFANPSNNQRSSDSNSNGDSCELQLENGNLNHTTIVGYLCYYYHMSTWVGWSIYVADVYVEPQYRRQGGAKLMNLELEAQAKRDQISILRFNLDADTTEQFVEQIVTSDSKYHVDRNNKTNWSLCKFYV